MPYIDFYEIVDVLASPDSIALGVDGSRGVVLGMAGDGDERSFAVLVGDTTFMLRESILAPTGKRVNREEIYGGETIRVDPERYSERNE